MRASIWLLAVLSAGTATAQSRLVPGAYIVRIDPNSEIDPVRGPNNDHFSNFRKQASDLNVKFSVRHKYTNPELFYGLSIQSDLPIDDEALSELPGVLYVEPVHLVAHPTKPVLEDYGFRDLEVKVVDPAVEELSMPNVGEIKGLDSALEMTGVDRLQAAGIKGQGMKIALIDTGIDYRHPALGGGFGPGFKVEMGYSWFDDNGNRVESLDPLSTCMRNAYGTHVAGIVGMDSRGEAGFDIKGVAPEATIFAYRVFGCDSDGRSDIIVAAMIQAYEDGADVIHVSMGEGSEDRSYQALVTKLKERDVPVIASTTGDDWVIGTNTQSVPASAVDAISVGAVSNAKFPLVYEAIDSNNVAIPYATVWPPQVEQEKPLYIIEPGCSLLAWAAANNIVEDTENTIFAVVLDDADACLIRNTAVFWSPDLEYIVALTANASTTYEMDYDVPAPGTFGRNSIISMDLPSSRLIRESYAAAGGYPNYKVNFTSKSYESPLQPSGGLVSLFSHWGPGYLDYSMKPQLSAPGGNILSTWPLGTGGGYAITSGTPMASAWVAGVWALMKSRFPHHSIDRIRELLQTTSNPRPWHSDLGVLTSTAIQGSGLINAYRAVFTDTELSPGQLTIGDAADHQSYGRANITITNKSNAPKEYTLSHVGAGYFNYVLTPEQEEAEHDANYGFAAIASPEVTVAAGESVTVHFTIFPPLDVMPDRLPVFSGFIVVTSDSDSWQVPYVGAPYSLYHADYIVIDHGESSGHPSPRITRMPDAYDTEMVNDDELEFSLSQLLLPIIVARTSQLSKLVRIDVLPANTSIVPMHYGFDPEVDRNEDYVPSLLPANSSFFGFPSHGSFPNRLHARAVTSLMWEWLGTTVVSDDFTELVAGVGDYRFMLSVLRHGGNESDFASYDSWLSPTIRIGE